MLSTVAVFLLAMYIPTVYKLFQMKWWLEEYSHAPLVIVVFFWLLWRERRLLQEKPDNQLHISGMAVFLLGLILYWLGVWQRAIVLETASIPFVLIGACYFLIGKSSFKWLFPVAYLIFIIPPPLFLVDMITFPLKKLVSISAAWVLGVLNYPITRRGVLLIIGDYKLLVADACSGMRSIINLMALIILYIYLQKVSIPRRVIILASIIPIALMANTVRVTALALITFHYGDAVGRSFYHDISGLVVFAIALASVVSLDKLLQFFQKAGRKAIT